MEEETHTEGEFKEGKKGRKEPNAGKKYKKKERVNLAFKNRKTGPKEEERSKKEGLEGLPFRQERKEERKERSTEGLKEI